VGSSSSGLAATPPIDDPQHAGHPGFSAADLANDRGTFQGIYRALNPSPADIVLLHVDANNMNNDDPNIIASDVDRILDEIDRWERDNNIPVTVFLTLIFDRSRAAGLFPPFPNPSVDALNNRLEQLAASGRRDGIVLVNQHHALNYSCNDTRDPLCDMMLQHHGFIHPDQDGYNKMATRWLDSIIASGKVAKCE
jgi:hypothetical protein